MNIKKRLIITGLISIFLVAILLLGSTYSIFTSDYINEDTNVYTTGNLNVTYTLSQENIKLSNSTPVNVEDSMYISPYRITITNIGTVPYMFDVILNDTTAGETIDYQYLMVQVGKLEPISLSDCTSNSDNNIIVEENVIVPAGEQVTVDVRVWISDSLQNSEISKSFYGKLSIDGLAVYQDNKEIDNNYLIAKGKVNLYSNNLLQNLNANETIDDDNISYELENKEVTITSKNIPSEVWSNIYINLTAGVVYEFSVDSSRILGTAGDTINSAYISLGLDKSSTTMITLDSAKKQTNGNYQFTPETSGTYYIKFGANKAGATYSFTDLKIYSLQTQELNYGETFDALPTEMGTEGGYYFAGWYSEEEEGGTQITQDDIYKLNSANSYYARFVILELTATKSESGTTVSSGNWSDEGLNFIFTATNTSDGYTIYYCQDTANTCTPNIQATANTQITTYNEENGIYYIRYNIVTSSGVSSSVSSYTAKVATEAPSTSAVTLTATKSSSGTTVSSGNWSDEGLNFTFTNNDTLNNYTIYYCKDTTNTCTPATEVTSGTQITDYNSATGTYYIRYKITNGAGVSSNIGSYTAKVDTTTPTTSVVTLTATKSSSGTTVSSGTWSDEGLNFKFTGSDLTSGYTIYYCKDTANTCTPSTSIAKGTSLTSYNTTTGTYYIRYKITNGAGVSSSVGSYTAKVDTTTPTITMASSSSYTYGTSTTIATATYGGMGGSVSCVNTSYSNQTVSNISSLRIGINSVKCTATGNNGKTATKTVSYDIQLDLSSSSTSLGVTGGAYRDSSNNIIIPYGGTQYGPYYKINTGCFQVIYNGNNLNLYPNGYKIYDQTAGTGNLTIYNLNYVSSNSNYYVKITTALDKIEIVLENLYASEDESNVITVSRIRMRSADSSYCS